MTNSVFIFRKETLNPVEIKNPVSTYKKGRLFCVCYMKDGRKVSDKFPLPTITRVTQAAGQAWMETVSERLSLEVHLNDESQPRQYNGNVIATSVEGEMFVVQRVTNDIALRDEFPLEAIFRIREDYNASTPS